MKKRIAALALLAALLLASALAQAQDGEIRLDASYLSPASPEEHHWTFTYSDEWFLKASTSYDHALARATLGLAVSAFRAKETADRNIRDYLTQAGFDNLVSTDYDREPTIDTVGTMMGSKRLDDGSTLVAVAICGAGYRNEWMSNLSIGGGEVHAGFWAASQKVYDRLLAYVADYAPTGTVRIWMGGFSRAAAVSNLTAERIMESGQFRQENVFVYSFATPRTTRSPKPYENVFCIVGKFDPVPWVPYAEWGYGRNGVELYTPAQETDSDYREKKEAVARVYRELTGLTFWNNTTVNHQLHMITAYLLSILPTSTDYAERMQPILLELWPKKSMGNISRAMVEMMGKNGLLDEEGKGNMQNLLDYLSNIAASQALGFVTGNTGFNKSTGMAENLMHEHSPDVYVAWMFSQDDPEALFSDRTAYVRLVLIGNARISLFSNDGFLFEIRPGKGVRYASDNQEYMDALVPREQQPLLSTEIHGYQTVLTLPKDQSFIMTIEPIRAGSFVYYGTLYGTGETQASMPKMHSVDMELGETYSVMSVEASERMGWLDNASLWGSGDDEYDISGAMTGYSPALLIMLENMNVFHLSWKQMAALAAAVPVVLVVTLTGTVLAVRRRRRRKKGLTGGGHAARGRGKAGNTRDDATSDTTKG